MATLESTPAPGNGCSCPNTNEEEEEFWPTQSPLLTGHRIHTIRLGRCGGSREGVPTPREPIVLQYKSMPTEELTPLDMIYGKSNNSEEPNIESSSLHFRETDEFYDGTGNLMWMAAVCFGHMVAQEVEPLWSYLMGTRGKETTGSSSAITITKDPYSPPKRMVCELGCGTGGAGMSLLLNTANTHDGISSNSCDSTSFSNANIHVVFTDNDAQSLDLCAQNCALNGLDSNLYSQELLGWGADHLAEASCLTPNSFDVVLATDVVYDLKMIAPLLETVEGLLRKRNESGSGRLVLSHVPRFCIPQEESKSKTNDETQTTEDSPSEAFVALEDFIVAEALKVGLERVAILRPHQVLSEEHLECDDDCSNNDDNDSMQQLTLEIMKEAHAVVFVFERSSS